MKQPKKSKLVNNYASESIKWYYKMKLIMACRETKLKLHQY